MKQRNPVPEEMGTGFTEGNAQFSLVQVFGSAGGDGSVGASGAASTGGSAASIGALVGAHAGQLGAGQAHGAGAEQQATQHGVQHFFLRQRRFASAESDRLSNAPHSTVAINDNFRTRDRSICTSPADLIGAGPPDLAMGGRVPATMPQVAYGVPRRDQSGETSGKLGNLGCFSRFGDGDPVLSAPTRHEARQPDA